MHNWIVLAVSRWLLVFHNYYFYSSSLCFRTQNLWLWESDITFRPRITGKSPLIEVFINTVRNSCDLWRPSNLETFFTPIWTKKKPQKELVAGIYVLPWLILKKKAIEVQHTGDCWVRLTSVRLIGVEGNFTSKDVTSSVKMDVIRTFLKLDIEDYVVSGIRAH